MGTKRSSGTVHTPKGVNQGNTLIDPNTGQPVDVVTDNQGTKRLAVDANITAQIPELQVELDFQSDSVSIGDSSSGSTLNINPDGSIDANVKVDAADGDNIAIGDGTKLTTITSVGSKNALDVNVASITGDAATETTLSNLNSKVITVDTNNVTITSSVLPTGAATSANQITANSSLSSIDSKLTSPLTIQATDLDIRNLTFIQDKVDVSGSDISVNNFPAVQPISDNGQSITVDGTVELGATSLAALENTTVTVSSPIDLSASTLAALENISIDNFPINQDVTVTSSVLPTGASTAALQTTGNTFLSNIETNQTDGTQRTQITDGTNNVAVQSTDPVNGVQGLVVRNIPRVRQTYSATVENLVIATAATDIFTITGSATKTVYIHKITVSGTRTAHNHDVLILNKRSTVNTGGAFTTRTAVTYDSLNATATAVVRAYTANPTLGTLIGNLKSTNVSFPVKTPTNAQGNGGAVVPWVWESTKDGQPITLRGVSQQVGLNMNGVSAAGSNFNITIEWSEE